MSTKKQLFALLVLIMLAWSGVLTYQTHQNWQASQLNHEDLVRQAAVNESIFQIFAQIQIWALSVEERLAPSDYTPISYTPAQWRPAPRPRREVLYVRVTNENRFQAVAVGTERICVLDTQAGTIACQEVQ